MAQNIENHTFPMTPAQLAKCRALLEKIRGELEAKLAAEAEMADKAGMSRADIRALMHKFLAEVDAQLAMVDAIANSFS